MTRARAWGCRPALLALVTLALLAWGGTSAQRLSVSFGFGEAHHAPELVGRAASVTLNTGVSGWRVARSDVDGWLMAELVAAPNGAGDDLGLASRFGAGTAWRHATTFGPLGNVLFEGGVSGSGGAGEGSELLARGWLGARGTVANVALRLAAEAGNAAPQQVEPGRPPPPDAGAREALRELDALRARELTPTGSWDGGLRLAATYRPERELTLDLGAAGRLVEGDLHLAARLSARRARVAPEVDGWLGLDASTYRGRRELAVGVGLFHVPRRAPSSWLRVWLGSGSAGVLPGVEASGARRWGPADLSLQASWRPWVAPSAWSAELGVDHAWADARVRWSLSATGEARGSSLWRLTFRWERDL